MKKNKINIIYGIILSILLLYFLYLIRTVYPFIVNNNFIVCDNCLSSIFPFIQKILTLLVAFALGNLLISYFRTVRFKNSLFPINHQSNHIKSLEKKYLLHNKIVVFNEVKLMAFSLGVFNPKIYLSTQLVKDMTRSEMEAIVLHEKQHIVGKDNLLLLLLSLLKTALFFLPVVSDFANNVEIQKEISADQIVAKETGEKTNIISALRKIIESKPSYVYANAFSESFSIEPRIRSLVGKKNQWFPLKFSSVVISLCVMLFLANITLSRIEIHPQLNSSAMLCLDKGICQNSCQ
ncbi:M56 family metallopeptidase [Patescibacteria group bacterium]|nr:M56 family metallopeptidase [Patescibacteria group bacterium]